MQFWEAADIFRSSILKRISYYLIILIRSPILTRTPNLLFLEENTSYFYVSDSLKLWRPFHHWGLYQDTTTTTSCIVLQYSIQYDSDMLSMTVRMLRWFDCFEQFGMSKHRTKTRPLNEAVSRYVENDSGNVHNAFMSFIGKTCIRRTPKFINLFDPLNHF